MIVRVVVAAADAETRTRVSRLLSGDGALVTTTTSVSRLLSSDKLNAADLVVAAIGSDARRERVRSVTTLRDPPDLVILADGTPSDEAELVTAGAAAVLSSRLSDDELKAALAALVVRSGRRGDLASRAEVVAGESEARSESMLELLELADRVADGDSSILILGETGAGKEWLARRVHDSSVRASGPFVAVNCAAIPEGLAESELFGHVRGAFTGAVRSRRGHFEMAHGGTLFLDEVSELSPAVQVRLLRALQDRSFQPVGSERPITVDLRVIAATNQSLIDGVEQGTFRKDLYYRLAVVTLSVPPLRDRADDVPRLVDHYLTYFARRLGRRKPTPSPAANAALAEYAWPGNIRELINVVERAVLLGATDTLTLADLPLEVSAPEGDAAGQDVVLLPPRSGGRAARAEGGTWKAAVAEFELAYLTGLLDAADGRLDEAAKRAGMSPRTLYNKMQRHGLRKENFRS